MRSRGSLGSGIDVVLDWLFPPSLYCACCGDLIDAGMYYSLCHTCMGKINWIQEEIKTDAKEHTKSHLFHRGFSCARYDSLTKAVLRRFKFERKADLAKPLGRLMWERIAGEALEVDGILAVPMHRRKEQLRGYNQAELLAREISMLWNAQGNGGHKYGSSSDLLWKDILLRTRKTGAMSVLPDLERRINLTDAFRIAEGGKRKLEGKRILLIDDVLTTGTTADECSRVLLAAGAKEINLLVFASGAAEEKLRS